MPLSCFDGPPLVGRRRAAVCLTLAVLSSLLAVACAADAASATTASASASTASTSSSTATPVIPVRHSTVIEHEAELPLDYSTHIHPYAWEHRRPDPYFLPHHTAYNIASQKELSSFLEVQTHLKAHSKEASRLKRIHAGYPGWAPADSKDQLDPKGFSTVMGLPPTKNPASYKLENDDYIASDFVFNPEMTKGSNRWRRAVYGLRRRRMPYWGVTAPFGSTNPFHRQNGFFSAPTDFLLSKPPNPLLAVRDPHVFDFGRLRGRETLLPYGGYSSFGSVPPSVAPGFYNRPHFAFRGGWPSPVMDATGSGYSGDAPRGLHDGHNNFWASPYNGWGGGGGGARAHGGFPAVPNFIPGDPTFFNFYNGLMGMPGGGGDESSSGG